MQGSGTTDDSDSDNRNTAMFGSPGIWARIHTIFYRYRTLIPTNVAGSGMGKKSDPDPG
jgi:hypothetical protein